MSVLHFKLDLEMFVGLRMLTFLFPTTPRWWVLVLKTKPVTEPSPTTDFTPRTSHQQFHTNDFTPTTSHQRLRSNNFTPTDFTPTASHQRHHNNRSHNNDFTPPTSHQRLRTNDFAPTTSQQQLHTNDIIPMAATASAVGHKAPICGET